mmetsp:Transcript_28903/g.21525  ORF Transcript_28903/g.21525 Transcript_28903/m.21525 type:complete len:163 (+) Transcript_28903:806-1294(+)|eukprot:CAMPEP_0202958508 /NCGR_PEP_ID=MMETSP1396-20130829/2838_1 /ASSEMBLY_ACC=CAM_ASM_000872 /TAXON_ID= /ORGANISM="Pseudokeronopsis sp., Strain Brazil" /LENGTH=162 /DNA_ID=CAMNT_0049676623 /DNA_START=806 /DNA_END=1294 /DNA_ORIENTATION=-
MAYCPHLVDIDGDTYYTLSFIMSGIVFNACGAFMGTIYEAKCMKVNLADESWHKTPHWKTVFRVAISYAVFFGCTSLFYLINASEFKYSVFLYLFLKVCLPCFLWTFFMFGLSRKLFMGLRLVNEGAIGRDFVADQDSGSKSGGGSLEFVEMEMTDQSKQQI